MPPAIRAWLEALVDRQNWRCYLARIDGEPVAGGAMFIGDTYVWLGIAATLPSARGKGAQQSLIEHRLQEAKSLGRAFAFTETGRLAGSNPSLRNMERLGFSCLYDRENWALRTSHKLH